MFARCALAVVGTPPSHRRRFLADARPAQEPPPLPAPAEEPPEPPAASAAASALGTASIPGKVAVHVVGMFVAPQRILMSGVATRCYVQAWSSCLACLGTYVRMPHRRANASCNRAQVTWQPSGPNWACYFKAADSTTKCQKFKVRRHTARALVRSPTRGTLDGASWVHHPSLDCASWWWVCYLLFGVLRRCRCGFRRVPRKQFSSTSRSPTTCHRALEQDRCRERMRAVCTAQSWQHGSAYS